MNSWQLPKINPSTFQKNIFSMFKGTFFAQIIGVIGSVYLAKLYGSEAYGIFGLFISISGILTIVNTLQLENIIVTLKSKSESKNLLNSLFAITFFIAVLAIIINYLCSFIIDFDAFNSNILYISIIASIAFSYIKIHESFFTYEKKFKRIANAKIALAFLNLCFQFILFQQFKLHGLIVGNIISIFSISLYYFFKNKKNLKRIDLQLLKKCLQSNRSIITFYLPSTLINSLAINIVPILIVSFFSLADTGVYFFTLKILGTPLFLISSSISQVYYQKSNEMFSSSKEKLYDFTKKIVVTNLLIMLLFLIFINTVGIYILELVFDKSWSNLRVFTLILSLLILARSSINPISNIILVLNKNEVSLVFNCYLLLVNLLAIFIGFKLNSFLISIILLSLLASLGYILLLIYFLKKLKKLKISHSSTA